MSLPNGDLHNLTDLAPDGRGQILIHLDYLLPRLRDNFNPDTYVSCVVIKYKIDYNIHHSLSSVIRNIPTIFNQVPTFVINHFLQLTLSFDPFGQERTSRFQGADLVELSGINHFLLLAKCHS